MEERKNPYSPPEKNNFEFGRINPDKIYEWTRLPYPPLKRSIRTQEDFLSKVREFGNRDLSDPEKETFRRVLASSSKELLGNPDLMQQAMEIDPIAFRYIPKDLQTNRDFVEKAILQNENVYLMLSEEQKKDPVFVKDYMESRMRNTEVRKLGEGDYVESSKYSLSKSVPLNLAYTDDMYKKAYEHILTNGIESKPQVKSSQWAYTVEFQNAMGLTHTYELQRDVIRKNQEQILSLASAHPRTKETINNILKVAEERCPELAEQIKNRQEKFWENHKEMVADLKMKQDLNEQLSPKDKILLTEAQKYLNPQSLQTEERRVIAKEVQKKTRKVAQKLIQENKNLETAFLRHDLIDKINSQSDLGMISLSDASLAIGRAESLPTVATSARAYQVLEKISDISNDRDDNEIAMERGGAIATIKEKDKDEIIAQCLEDIMNGQYDQEMLMQLWATIDPDGYERSKEEKDHGIFTSPELLEKKERILEAYDDQ